MTEQELLEKVKVMTNYTSEYHNEFLSGWITEAKSILANSGLFPARGHVIEGLGVIFLGDDLDLPLQGHLADQTAKLPTSEFIFLLWDDVGVIKVERDVKISVKAGEHVGGAGSTAGVKQ